MSDLVATGAAAKPAPDPVGLAADAPSFPRAWRVARVVIGLGYLVAAAVCAFVLPGGHPFSLLAIPAAMLFLVGDNINLWQGESFVSCQQGAFVLLCFAMPLNLVPLALIVLEAIWTPKEWRWKPSHVYVAGVNSWTGFAAPVLLSVLAPGSASWHHWMAYLAAFGGQFVLSELLYLSRCHLRNARVDLTEAALAVTVDAGLTPIGLAAATDLHTSSGGAFAIMIGATALLAVAGHEHRHRTVQTGRALRDPMTGLANRALFEETLTACESRCRREQEHAAVLLVDLDDFKLINDTLGHHAGDEALRAFADGLRGSVRAIDTPARLGGDEFAVILAEPIDLDGAGRVAEKLKQRFAQPIRLTTGQNLTIGFSSGFALFGYEISAQDATMQADVELYAHKRSRKHSDPHEAPRTR
jgi:diguanylate cyclase (GGDEF)-like protein